MRYNDTDACEAVLERMRRADERAGNQQTGGFVWCYAALEPVQMPDGGTLGHAQVKRCVELLIADGRCVREGKAWRRLQTVRSSLVS